MSARDDDLVAILAWLRAHPPEETPIFSNAIFLDLLEELHRLRAECDRVADGVLIR
jgi:hypothetical protein